MMRYVFGKIISNYKGSGKIVNDGDSQTEVRTPEIRHLGVQTSVCIIIDPSMIF